MPLSNSFEVIVLAAGLSSRMGKQNKLLLEIENQPLIFHTCQIYIRLGFDTHVVLGHDADEVQAALEPLPIKPVYHNAYRNGQHSSVLAGLEHCSLQSKGVIIALGDQPFLNIFDIEQLCRQFEKHAQSKIVVPYWQNQRGNPVIFPNQVIDFVRRSSDQITCRDYIDNNPETVFKYNASSPHFIQDLDTPEDIEKHLNTKSG